MFTASVHSGHLINSLPVSASSSPQRGEKKKPERTINWSVGGSPHMIIVIVITIVIDLI